MPDNAISDRGPGPPEATRELLALELSHRIKNILSVVSGIVALASRGQPELRAFVRIVQSRIDALALAHDYLLGRPGAPLAKRDQTVHGLVRLMTAPFSRNDDAIAVHGPDIVIGPQMASYLALLLHELATNAVKYGALSRESGRITIACAEIDGRYAITWREDGGPPIDGEPESNGFGTAMFERVAALAGIGVKRSWSPKGLRVAIVISSNRAAE